MSSPSVVTLPERSEWTEPEYLALRANSLMELSGGFLDVHPMPTLLHQLIVKFLANLLDAYVTARGLGTVVFAPLPIRLSAGTYREPDVIYLKPERIDKVRGYPQGADLVMEVVSEGEKERLRDLQTKRREYAKAGIAEYWIVDPQERQITVLTLDGAEYREHGVFGAGTQASSVLLPGFAVAVDSVFAVAQE